MSKVFALSFTSTEPEPSKAYTVALTSQIPLLQQAATMPWPICSFLCFAVIDHQANFSVDVFYVPCYVS